MTNSPLHSEVAIVGGGPIGLELGVALQRAGMSFQILEAGTIGNTISWWAPQTRWFSSNERIAIANVPLLTIDQSKATREQYLNYLRGVVSQYQLPVRTFCKVQSIETHGNLFQLISNRRGQPVSFTAEKVVLAIGGTDFNRKLGIPGEDLPHVDGYLRETHRYHGRRVLIVGGRNSAVEAALRLHHVGAHVTLCHRGPSILEDGIKYWLLPEINGLIRTGRIEAYFNHQPECITEQNVQLKRHDGERTTVDCDDVLTLIGYGQDKTLLKNAGVELIGETERPLFDPQTMQTNVPGIYVAGTAIAGTQTSHYKTFLENCHDHVDRIVADLTGGDYSESEPEFMKQIESLPES